MSELIQLIIQAVMEAQTLQETIIANTLTAELAKTPNNIASAIKMAIQNLPFTTEELTAIIEDARTRGGTLGQLLRLTELMIEARRPEHPPTMEEVFADKTQLFEAHTSGVASIQNLAGWLDQIPFLNLGTAARAQLQNPRVQATTNMATDFFSGHYEFGQRWLLQRYWMKLYQPMIPEVYRLADMMAKGIISTERYTQAMSENGFNIEWAEQWRVMMQAYPTPDVALALLRRGVINDEIFKAYLKYNNYEEGIINILYTLKDVIPPISDLIRFAVREAYLDHIPEKQYGEMVKQAGKMGLTPEVAEWYWYSHWDRIPITLMYQNYYRGYWDRVKLERMLKIVDIHPDDREDIMNVAYQPPSIREQGYGYDVGAYTPDDIERYRRWGGLSPDDAKKATLAMIAYRTEAERNAVRTELMYAYARDKITVEELTNRLMELPTPDEALPLWLERAEWYKDRIKKPQMDVEGRVVSSSEAITAFKLGLRDESWLRSALSDLDWTEDRINLAVEKAKHDIAPVEEVPEEPKYQQLTATQMRQLYLRGLITDEDILAVFIARGYTPDDAILLTDLYTYVEEKPVEIKPFTTGVAQDLLYYTVFDDDDLHYNFTLQGFDDGQSWLLVLHTILQQEYPLLRKLYGDGIINSDQLKQELINLGLPEYNAMLLVQRTEYEVGANRLLKEKDLTKAEIIKGVKNNVISYAQGIELLVDIGYNINEADYLLKINKVVEAGDPESYLEMKRVTEAYKKTRGEKVMEIPEEALVLEMQIKEVKAELDRERKIGANEIKIGELSVKLANLESRLRTVLAKSSVK